MTVEELTDEEILRLMRINKLEIIQEAANRWEKLMNKPKALTDSDYPPIGKHVKDGPSPRKLGQCSNVYLKYFLTQGWVKDKHPEFWNYLQKHKEVIQQG